MYVYPYEKTAFIFSDDRVNESCPQTVNTHSISFSVLSISRPRHEKIMTSYNLFFQAD